MGTTPGTSEGGADAELGVWEQGAHGAPAHPWPARRKDGLGQEGAAEGSGAGWRLTTHPSTQSTQVSQPSAATRLFPSENAGAGKEQATLQAAHFTEARSGQGGMGPSPGSSLDLALPAAAKLPGAQPTASPGPGGSSALRDITPAYLSQ